MSSNDQNQPEKPTSFNFADFIEQAAKETGLDPGQLTRRAEPETVEATDLSSLIEKSDPNDYLLKPEPIFDLPQAQRLLSSALESVAVGSNWAAQVLQDTVECYCDSAQIDLARDTLGKMMSGRELTNSQLMVADVTNDKQLLENVKVAITGTARYVEGWCRIYEITQDPEDLNFAKQAYDSSGVAGITQLDRRFLVRSLSKAGRADEAREIIEASRADWWIELAANAVSTGSADYVPDILSHYGSQFDTAVFECTDLIMGLVQGGFTAEARQLFDSIEDKFVPDEAFAKLSSLIILANGGDSSARTQAYEFARAMPLDDTTVADWVALAKLGFPNCLTKAIELSSRGELSEQVYGLRKLYGATHNPDMMHDAVALIQASDIVNWELQAYRKATEYVQLARITLGLPEELYGV